MPEIGAPADLRPNPYRRVKMASDEMVERAELKNKDPQSVGDRLNEISGRSEMKSGIKFVERKAHNKLGKDEFLKLLTVQLKNQDPLDPMDQKQFAADMAQFSQLEQLTNMNTKLETMGQNASPEMKFYGASFLGKEVVTKGTTLDLLEVGKSHNLGFKLPQKASRVLVRVFDEKGQQVRQMEANNVLAGHNQIPWDGKAGDGVSAAKGKYSFRVHAWDDTGAHFMGSTQAKGLVTGVHFDKGRTVLDLKGGKKIFLHDVESFMTPSNNKKEVATQAKAGLPPLEGPQ